MNLKLNKKTLLSVNWNTKREIALRMVIIVSAILFFIMSFFIGHGWGQSFLFYWYIVDFISYSKFASTAIIFALFAMFVTAIFTIMTLIVMIKVKEVGSLKIWILIIVSIWIIYFLVFFIISIKMGQIYWSKELLGGFIGNIFNLLLNQLALFYLWKEIKYQNQLKIFFDYRNYKKMTLPSINIKVGMK